MKKLSAKSSIDVVERGLAMRPVVQEMADVGAAGLVAGADQRGRHLHLVERLVPDVVQPVGRGHPRPDAGIDEIEEKQPGNALRCPAGERLHNGAADVVADHAGLLDPERIQQRQHVVGMLIGAK